MSVNIRMPASADAELILHFIKELTRYEKVAYEVVATE